MGLVATTTAQSSQSIKEEPAPHPSCSSSAEDEQSSKERANHGSDRESNSNKTEHETDNRPTITVDCPGTDFPFSLRYQSLICLCWVGHAILRLGYTRSLLSQRRGNPDHNELLSIDKYDVSY